MCLAVAQIAFSFPSLLDNSSLKLWIDSIQYTVRIEKDLSLKTMENVMKNGDIRQLVAMALQTCFSSQSLFILEFKKGFFYFYFSILFYILYFYYLVYGDTDTIRSNSLIVPYNFA